MDKLIPFLTGNKQEYAVIFLLITTILAPFAKQIFDFILKVLTIKKAKVKIVPEKECITYDKLLEDDLFSKSVFYLTKIKSFRFFSDINSFLFRALLKQKVEIVSQFALKWLTNNENNISNFTVAQIHSIFQDLVLKMIEGYETAFFDFLVERFQNVNAAKELFALVVPEFRNFHQHNIENLQGQLAQIPNSQFLDNNFERISFFFQLLHWALKVGIFDAERMFANKNGQAQEVLDKYNLAL